MVRHASHGPRQRTTRRLVAHPILLACVLVAVTVTLYAGFRHARSSPNPRAVAGSPPGAAAAQPVRAAGGVKTALPPDRKAFLVATRQPDGRVALSHATGKQLAESQAHGGASIDSMTSDKETGHDR